MFCNYFLRRFNPLGVDFSSNARLFFNKYLHNTKLKASMAIALTGRRCGT